MRIPTRTLSILPFLAALSVGPLAFADDAIQVKINAGNQYRPTASEVQDALGTYAMSNGQTVKVSSEQNRLYVQIGDRGRTELVATGGNAFASRDRDTRMVVTPQAFGGEIALSYIDTRSAGLAQEVTLVLVASR